jgi:hypothetical protein
MAVLFCNLTPEEYEWLYNTLPHSGRTGAYAHEDEYGGLAPYISTYRDSLNDGVHLLGWEAFSVEIQGPTWVVRKLHTHTHTDGPVRRIKLSKPLPLT